MDDLSKLRVIGYKFPYDQGYCFTVKRSGDKIHINMKFRIKELSLTAPALYCLVSPAFEIHKEVHHTLTISQGTIATSTYAINRMNEAEKGPRYTVIQGKLKGHSWIAFLKYGTFIREVILFGSVKFNIYLRNNPGKKWTWKRQCIRLAAQKGFSEEYTKMVLRGMVLDGMIL